jgi:23S rRNA (adenine2503-C2)-methyltransferase
MPAQSFSVTDLPCSQFDSLAISHGEPSFRARQIKKWVYQKLAANFDEMTDLPEGLRRKLMQDTRLHSLETEQQIISKDGTIKILFKCHDGNTIESALMYYGGNGDRERRTVCVSTQAGCSIGCPFCATGRQGFQRNLTPGEINDQVLFFARFLREQQGKNPEDEENKTDHVSNVVFMGMGEPLVNYDNLWQAIEILNSPDCFKLGARNMTISTSGLVPGIQRLSTERLQVGLAVSLHAADNHLRDRLVPINKKYPLEALLPVCREYSRLTGRRLSFEYILFAGVNDSLEQARKLADLIHDFRCHVNLITANKTENTAYGPPPKREVLAFENELIKHGINVTLRSSRGQDIDAGCGQLRSRYLGAGGKRRSINTSGLDKKHV